MVISSPITEEILPTPRFGGDKVSVSKAMCFQSPLGPRERYARFGSAGWKVYVFFQLAMIGVFVLKTFNQFFPRQGSVVVINIIFKISMAVSVFFVSVYLVQFV